MSHHHHDSHASNKRVLLVSFCVIFIFMFVELVGGLWTNSLVLLSDAGHMFSDALSLFIALLAFIFGAKASTLSKTFGYRRVEILAAALNGLTLILIAVWIIYEAIMRLYHPPEIATISMLFISILGLLINIGVAWYMLKNSEVKNNINMLGAYAHVLGDLLGSVGAIVAGLLIMFFGWVWADAVISALVALLIMKSGIGVMIRASNVLMEGAPLNINLKELESIILSSSGVLSIHDMHVWSISSGMNVLMCHIALDGELTIKEAAHVVGKIKLKLHQKDIQHATIEVDNIEMCGYEQTLLCSFDSAKIPPS